MSVGCNPATMELYKAIKHIHDLPFSMPLKGHNTILVTNAIMETMDLYNKKIKNI